MQKHHPFNISIKHLENIFIKTTYVRYLKCILKILQNSQYIEKSKFNKNYYENKVNEIFLHEVYRDLSLRVILLSIPKAIMFLIVSHVSI
jgi:hypothetical protein